MVNHEYYTNGSLPGSTPRSAPVKSVMQSMPLISKNASSGMLHLAAVMIAAGMAYTIGRKRTLQ